MGRGGGEVPGAARQASQASKDWWCPQSPDKNQAIVQRQINTSILQNLFEIDLFKGNGETGGAKESHNVLESRLLISLGLRMHQ